MTGVVMTIVRGRGPGLLPLGLLPLHVAEDEPLLLNKFDFLQKNIYIEYASISSDNNHNITEYQLIGLSDIQQKRKFPRQVQRPIKTEQMKETSPNVLAMSPTP